MNVKIIIFGCGSQSKYVIDNLISKKIASNKDFLLVDIENNGKIKNNGSKIEIINDINLAIDIIKNNKCSVLLAHGDNKLKESIFKKFSSIKANFLNAIHINSCISSRVKIGKGNIINSGTTVMPDAKIGSNNILHSGTIIEHDCLINDFVNIGPGVTLAGGVEIGNRSYIYTGVKIAPRVKIGYDTIIGAGSLVLKDLPSGVIAFGSPAKIMRKNK